MDAKPLSIGKILSERQRFVVPIYQRTYSWTRRELEPLFEQVELKASELLSTGRVAFSHYMGALLLIPDGEPVFGRIQVFNVVDGQQRLTTFHLCFAALRDLARDHGFDDISAQLSDLIIHGPQTPMSEPAVERYKLQPTAYDRVLLTQLIDLDRTTVRERNEAHFFKNRRIRQTAAEALWAYWYIWDEAEDFVTEGRPTAERESLDPEVLHRRLLALSTVLFEHFRLIVITLSKNDDAQVIFETLNSGGRPLAAMDLVRNDVFHRASRRGEDQQALLDTHWSEFEQPFWKQEQTQGRIKKPRIDFFLAHVLAAEQGRSVAMGELFSEYKAFISQRAFPDTASELAMLTRHAPAYRVLAEPSGEGALARLSRRLNTFDVSTAYPLVLVIAASGADEATKARLYDLIASYVIRRALCYLTPKNYNNIFVEVASVLMLQGVSEAAFADAFQARAGLETSMFPTDTDLAAAIAVRPQYGWIPQSRLRLLLEELEFAARDKFNVNGTLQEGLQIEHVMPQTWMTCWPLPSGRTAPADLVTGADEAMLREIDARKATIQTLGNLTLLTPPANANASNAGFPAKRVRLHDSLLKLNVTIAAEPEWDELAIRRRSDAIASLAIQLWPFPKGGTAADATS